MMSTGIIFDSSNNFGIIQTDTLFDFSNIKSAESLGVSNDGNFRRSFADVNSIASPIVESKKLQQRNYEKKEKTIGKKHHKKKHTKHKFKKCIYKLFKGKKKKHKFLKNFLMPIILGLFVAKSLFIPIVLKTFALIAAKGLILGLFSTIMSSIVSLKGMINHPYGHRNRKNDGKTRVEIIHVPVKADHNNYVRPFRRKDLVMTPTKGEKNYKSHIQKKILNQ